MAQFDHLASMLNHIINSKRVRKRECQFRPSSKLLLGVLEIMKNGGYIEEFKSVKDSRGGYIEIKLGKLNFCKAIKPRFNVKKENFDKYVRRYLPSRNLGIIIVSTTKGLMTQGEAIEQNLGGRLLAFCY